MAARDKIRKFFEDNVGKIITTHQIAEVAQISEYARRIRELRDEEGMQIKSCNDRHDLKPNEYVLESLERLPVISRNISTKLRTEILERNGYTCQLCGTGANEIDPIDPSKKTTLHIDHIKPISQGGANSKSNLRVLCSTCNQGRANIEAPSETALNILARIRRCSRIDQKIIYEKLKHSFGEDK